MESPMTVSNLSRETLRAIAHVVNVEKLLKCVTYYCPSRAASAASALLGQLEKVDPFGGQETHP